MALRVELAGCAEVNDDLSRYIFVYQQTKRNCSVNSNNSSAAFEVHRSLRPPGWISGGEEEKEGWEKWKEGMRRRGEGMVGSEREGRETKKGKRSKGGKRNCVYTVIKFA